MSVSGDVPEVDVEQDEDDGQRERHDDLESLLGALHVLESTAPLEGVPGRNLHLLGNLFASRLHVGPKVDAPYVDLDPGVQTSVLALDRRRPLKEPEGCHLLQGDVLSAGRRHEHATQGLDVVPEGATVPEVHGVAFQAFDGFRDVHASDGGHDHVLHILDGKPVPAGFVAIDVDVQIVTAEGLVRIRRDRPGYVPKHTGHFGGDILEHLQVRTRDLDPHRRNGFRWTACRGGS